MDGYIHRLSGGDECSQVGGLPVSIICGLKGTEMDFGTRMVVQALDSLSLSLYLCLSALVLSSGTCRPLSFWTARRGQQVPNHSHVTLPVYCWILHDG